ncbi:MAG: type II toxin-antitoxin system VapC family toxin [Planctomycetes bacterium]|nr:type II toxin-antitoxin system VapC family toxin [Planctomycetota bacterium]
MRVILDTCVVSETVRKGGNARVQALLESLKHEETFISAITFGEISYGIGLLKPGRKRSELEAFLIRLEQDYQSQILSVGLEVARAWGDTTAALQRKGKTLPIADGLIAATAICHGLYVVTRNVKDFELTGVRVINPWE